MRASSRRRSGYELVVITFEDPVVKQICVSNWGGGLVADEITTLEAESVGSLGDAFRNSAYIAKFNEFVFFNSLSSLANQFYNCSKLTEITIPRSLISDFTDAFRNCDRLVSVDISPTRARNIKVDGVVRNCDAIQTLRIPGTSYSSMANMLYNSSVTTLEIEGVADFSGVHQFTQTFVGCNSLTTITGSITGISADLNIKACPLTRASALVILNGLADTQSSRTVTFSASTFSELTDDDIDIAIEKGWQLASA